MARYRTTAATTVTEATTSIQRSALTSSAGMVSRATPWASATKATMNTAPARP